MQFEKFNRNTYVLRLVKGEKLMETLEKFCNKERVDGAFFFGIGAVEHVELAHYNVTTQKYSSKNFNTALEVTNLSGSIALHENNHVIHAHGTFSDTEMVCIGGHVVDFQVSGTLEIQLHKLGVMAKLTDSETGLKLLNLPYSI